MKKYFLLLVLALFFTSCSKKVDFSGTIKGGSPLERVEFIEASGVATLPLVNIGIDKDGKFSGSFDAPKDGMYVLTYAGKENLIYLKQGQKLQISGNAETFPQEFKIEGDAKNNNDFIQAVQKFMTNYTQNLNLAEIVGKDEKAFLVDMKKIEADLMKNIDETAEKTKADKQAVEWKKEDIRTGILSVLPNYEMQKKQTTGNPAYKSSKAFTDFEESLQKDKEKMVADHPAYRNYLLSKMGEDFQKFAEAKPKTAVEPTTSEMFAEYLKKREEISQKTKDYLLAKGMTDAKIGLILGSGLGDLANEIENPIAISYEKIPNFPLSTVVGHEGKLVYGTISGQTVIALQGRFHYSGDIGGRSDNQRNYNSGRTKRGSDN